MLLKLMSVYKTNLYYLGSRHVLLSVSTVFAGCHDSNSMSFRCDSFLCQQQQQ